MTTMKAGVTSIVLLGVAVWGISFDRSRMSAALAKANVPAGNATIHSARPIDDSKLLTATTKSQLMLATTPAPADRQRRAFSASPSSTAERFVASHRLMTIASGGRSSLAIIDRSVIKIGESIDGFRLTSIEHRSARFVDDDGTTTELQLDATPAGARLR